MNSSEAFAEFSAISLIEAVTFLAGIVVIAVWLIQTGLGRRVLAGCPVRRNNMPLYTPFIPLFIWVGGTTVAVLLTGGLTAELEDWQGAFTTNVILCVGAAGGMVATLWLARRHFVRGLKGFGLRPKTALKDLYSAVLNLLAAWPVVLAVMIATLLIGELFQGESFKIEQHDELKLIGAYEQLSLRVLIVITTAVIAPIFEEMLFRGLFQTLGRSYLSRPWPAIFITSVLFAITHGNMSH